MECNSLPKGKDRRNMSYFSHPSGGPVWSRERGYHHPDPSPFPQMIRRREKEPEEPPQATATTDESKVEPKVEPLGGSV